ncbi:MAG: hypothetical protein AB7T49_13030 [Oligoflexales bacterium]
MVALRALFLAAACGLLTGCPLLDSIGGSKAEAGDDAKSARLVMFIGVDISGSFKNTSFFKDSIRFTAHYIYMHLKGLGGLEVPHSLFVGSIGGAKPNEPKTFWPIETFQYKSIPEIEKKLYEIFPAKVTNQFTDYNAFFRQITTFVRDRKLVMKPISIVLLSDGVPDAPKVDGKLDYRSFQVEPLETLSRDVTLRLLYTTAEVGMNWQTKIPRKKVKIWTQDANVMKTWKEKDIFLSKTPIEKQERLLSWVTNNVDFAVPAKRVD